MTQTHGPDGRSDGGGRLTPFGQLTREIRKEKGLLLIDMARAAGVTSGFLSLVESGGKPIPDRLVPAIVAGLDLNADTARQLAEAAALSAKEYKIQVAAGAATLDRRVAHALQSGFAKLTPDAKTKILKLLEES
jgi:transcriptional regulator with XRE-family HTH domain